MAIPQKDLDVLKKEMLDCLSMVDIKDVSLDNVTMRLGGRIVKLQVIADERTMSIEDEIRKEYSDKLTKKLGSISEVIHNKMNEVTSMVGQVKGEFERKEKIMNDRMKNLSPMPDITFDHARRGLSVIKIDNGQLGWLVRGKYKPLMIDMKPIKPLQAKKLESEIYFLIITKDRKVMSVTTRNVLNLDYFSHYHQATPDCWGRWKHPSEFNDPSDLIAIARTAEGVLENINTGSAANRTPTGLPRIDILQKYIVSTTELKNDLLSEENKGIAPSRRRTSSADENIQEPISPAPPRTTSVDDVWEAR